MSEMFASASPPEGSEIDTTTAVATTEERPLQYKVDEERGPTITTTALKATT